MSNALVVAAPRRVEHDVVHEGEGVLAPGGRLEEPGSPPGPSERVAGAPGRTLPSFLLLFVVFGVVLTSCASTRSELGTNDGPCFVALPAASAALHGQGRFVGILRLSRNDLLQLTRLAAISGPVPSMPGQACVAAYQGHFEQGAVSRWAGEPSGSKAVVVLTYPGNRIVMTLVTDQLPPNFRHTHLGG